MALQKERTYMVLNYNSSPIALTTKNGSFLLEGGTRTNPAVLPMTIDEIVTANTNGYAFKYGFARFEEEFQEDIYQEIRIHNWKEILTDEEIEYIIVHPTAENLERIIAIENEIYFGRVVGVHFGLKSIFADISPKVDLVIEQRKTELRNKQRKSEIVISKSVSAPVNSGVNQEEIDNIKVQNEMLMAQMAEMKKMLENQQSIAKNADTVQPTDGEKKTAGRPKTAK